MALRVLLADESSTIRKVIQLSLQDFNVDVKSVTVGLDVLSVAKTFRPDVILADVLLAKRSGYEVCHDIKNDQETAQIPVVLMWSGFMDIDEQKARLCGADRRLEKPFDASALRQIIQEVVARTQNNPTSAFLQFPNLPPFEEPKSGTPQAGAPMPAQTRVAPTPVAPQNVPVDNSMKPQIPSHAPADDGALIIDDSDEIESSDEWVQQPIAPKTQVPAGQATAPTFPLQTQNTQAPKSKEDDFTEFPLTPQQKQPKQTVAPQNQSQSKTPIANSPAVSEEIMREEIQKWLAQHMPEIAERLIRDEINRLLQETEKTIQGP